MRERSTTVTPERGPLVFWVMAAFLASGPPRIQPDIYRGGTDYDGAAKQSEVGRPFAVDHPHPDWPEHELQQAEQGCPSRRNALEAREVKQQAPRELSRAEGQQPDEVFAGDRGRMGKWYGDHGRNDAGQRQGGRHANI